MDLIVNDCFRTYRVYVEATALALFVLHTYRCVQDLMRRRPRPSLASERKNTGNRNKFEARDIELQTNSISDLNRGGLLVVEKGFLPLTSGEVCDTV